jgi:hypothetical protein
VPLGPVPLTLIGRSACLGSNQNVRSHDFRHAFDELEASLAAHSGAATRYCASGP